MTIQLRFLFAAAACAAATLSGAAEAEYAVRVGLTHSDNIERLPEGQERGTRSAVAGFELRSSRDTGRLTHEAVADLSYYEYLNLDLDAELLGNASLAGSYQLLPEKFLWNANLAYDQIREDILRPQAVGNRESQVAFSTGPSLRSRIGGVVDAELDGHYARRAYSDRPFDSETIGGRALLGRRPSARSLLALGYSYDDVSYVSSAAPTVAGYERQEMFGRVELQGVRTELEVEAGYAEISGAQVDDGGAVVRARLQRRMTPMLTGFVGYVREYPTSEETPATDAVGEPGDASELTGSPRVNTRAEAGVRLERPRSNASLAYALRKESSLLAGEGRRTYHELRVDFSRAFTPRTRGTLFATATRENISFAADHVTEQQAGFELAFTFGRALGLDLRLAYHDRNGASAADTYDEFSAGLFLRYAGAFGRRASP